MIIHHAQTTLQECQPSKPQPRLSPRSLFKDEINARPLHFALCAADSLGPIPPISAPDTARECTKGAQYHSCPSPYQRGTHFPIFCDSARWYAVNHFWRENESALSSSLSRLLTHSPRATVADHHGGPRMLLYLMWCWPLNHDYQLISQNFYRWPATETT